MTQTGLRELDSLAAVTHHMGDDKGTLKMAVEQARVEEPVAIAAGMGRRRPRVVVVGAGFGGIHVAQGLANAAVDVTLVDRRNYHVFQPLLYQVALAVLSPADIAQPIRLIVRNLKNVAVLMEEVVGLDTADQRVTLQSGRELEYDFLVLATGSTHSYFGKKEWAANAPGLKTVEDALEIRRRVLLSFELAEREMLETGSHPPLNFVIVGGGPTGVELAGAISDIAKLNMKHDFRHIDPKSARVIILEGSPRILGMYPEDLQEKARQQLEGLGVEVRLSAHVTDVQPGYVMLGDERVDSVCTLWAAGVEASPLGKMLGVETDHKGSVKVDPYLNPAGLKNVFVIGDLAAFDQNGKPVPGVAQPAMQMGDYAAKRISGMIAGKVSPKGFHYFDKGDMATIGRAAAIANVQWPFKAHLSGFPAWISWLAVHIFFLIGFRNRLSVFRSWAWTYLTFSDSARLITGSQDLPGWGERLVPSSALPVAPEMGSPKA